MDWLAALQMLQSECAHLRSVCKHDNPRSLCAVLVGFLKVLDSPLILRCESGGEARGGKWGAPRSATKPNHCLKCCCKQGQAYHLNGVLEWEVEKVNLAREGQKVDIANIEAVGWERVATMTTIVCQWCTTKEQELA